MSILLWQHITPLLRPDWPEIALSCPNDDVNSPMPVQYFSTLRQYTTSAQYVSTILQYNTSVQCFSTILQHSTSVQHFSTLLQYKSHQIQERLLFQMCAYRFEFLFNLPSGHCVPYLTAHKFISYYLTRFGLENYENIIFYKNL